MGRLNWRRVGICAMWALPLAAHSQTPFNLNNEDQNAPANVIGGTPTIDLITVRANTPGIPLRHGNVVPGSERVQLQSAILNRGTDYSMDYATGVVYVARALKAGDAVTVSYRYTNQATQSSSLNLNGIAGFKYDIAPGAMSMTLGYGMTERTADGQVISTNLFGLNNNFNIGGGAIKGLYYFGDRQKVDANSIYDPVSAQGAADEGQSQMIVQSLQTKFMGGSLNADYQNISKNFKSFGAATSAGYNAGQLEKERGLTRIGFDLKDVKVGSSKIGSMFKTVGEGASGIDWRSYSFASGGLELNFNSQRVDSDFTRFADLAEQDREQLKKELGMSRESYSAKFASKAATMSFSTDKIEDMRAGNGLEQRKLALKTGNIDLNLGERSVDKSFTRVGSLKGDETALYGREVGLKRQWLSLEAGLLGKSYQPIKFSQSLIDSNNGSYRAQDVSVGGKGWSLEHSSRTADKGFAGFAPLDKTEEGNKEIAAIANMYGKGLKYNLGNEQNYFKNSAGIGRSFDRLTAEPFKGWTFQFDSLRLTGQEDGGSVNTIALNGKDFNVNYRKQNLGQKFNEFSSLMEFERNQLGAIAGLDRTDFSLNMNLKGSKLAYSQTSADTSTGGMSRQQFAYSDKKLQVSANAREVDPGFDSIGSMVDPEKNMLAGLKGFNEHDVNVAWQILPNLHLSFTDYSADSDSLSQFNRIQNTVLNWKPSKNTEIGYVKYSNNSNDPLSVLFANVTEKISLVQNLGRMGTFKWSDETQQFDGSNATQADFQRQYFSLETALDKNTKVKTEQTRTSYDNGDRENVSANTVSTNLSKRLGVSLTETKVDRNGDDRDESNRNYGFWYDLGSGVQIAYGYARQLNGDNGATQQNFSVGQTANLTSPDKAGATNQATMGGIKFGGGYGEQSWDGSTERTQAFSKMSIGTSKPFKFGFLSDVNLNFGVDTAADYSKWVRENKMLGFSGKIGSNSLGFNYLGQMYTNGVRAVDRTFTFATDQSDKRWLRASIFYKARTLPYGDQVMIRNFNVTAKPSKNVELTHQLVTNPEVAKGDAILGSIPQAARSSSWKLDYKNSGYFTVGGEWKEMVNEQNNALSRTGSINVTLFEKSGSPLKLSYGLEEVNGNVKRRVANRYSLQFDQKAGPNQTFSFFAGNLNYMYDIADGFKKNNWTLRMDYQLRF